MRYIEQYEALYRRSPSDVAFCPCRVCPLGAQTDHQLGRINGLAIDKGIHFAYSKKESGICEIYSVNFPNKRAQFHVNAIPKTRRGDWADHLRGATLKLQSRHSLIYGVAGVLEGELPIGGLSSSAAVIIAFLTALCKVNEIRLAPWELIMIAKEAENDFVGVSCGKLDQSCEVFCRKDYLLDLDTRDDSFSLIPTPTAMKPYRIAVFFSGLERSLKDSNYNVRVDECKAAAYTLKAFAGIPYAEYDDTTLRDVPVEVYHRYRDRLPQDWKKRAEHFYTEMARVEAGVEAWRAGDLDEYGKLVFESGYSSIHNYECGCPELIQLYEIIRRTDGIYGGRFSGAGFKGCCMALIDPAFADRIEQQVGEAYLKAFPAMRDKYSFHLCESSDGVSL